MYHQNFSCSIRRTRHRQSLTELESHLSDESLGSAAYMGTVRLPLVKSDAESTPLRDALKSDLRRRTPEATCRQRMPRTWQHHWHPGPGSIPFLRAALVSSYASGPVSYPAKPSVATRQTAHATCVMLAQRIYCTYPFGKTPGRYPSQQSWERLRSPPSYGVLLAFGPLLANFLESKESQARRFALL